VIFIPAQNWPAAAPPAALAAATGEAAAPPAALAAATGEAAAPPAALAAGEGVLDELHALTTNRTANANAGSRH
jgi:hypothetical protein